MTSENNSTTVHVQSWFIPIDILNMICCIIAIILALVFLFVIIFDKTYQTVGMMLVTNSCIAELIFGSDLLAMGYISYIITWICCIIYPIPLVFTGQIKYLVDDQICQMPLQLSFLTIFNAIYIYLYPMLSIILIYLKMVQYVHEMRKHITPVNRLFHARRDLRMIRRIVSLVFILIALGFPYQTFIIMSFFNIAPKYHFRIAFMFIDVSLVFVLIALLEITEPLKTSLMKRITVQSTNITRTVT
ncbi:unnamed protein product [Rotaria sp. Silwood1]|nr:unnamed protein product [Rotaria sp. Silwood1]